MLNLIIRSVFFCIKNFDSICYYYIYTNNCNKVFLKYIRQWCTCSHTVQHEWRTLRWLFSTSWLVTSNIPWSIEANPCINMKTQSITQNRLDDLQMKICVSLSIKHYKGYPIKRNLWLIIVFFLFQSYNLPWCILILSPIHTIWAPTTRML